MALPRMALVVMLLVASTLKVNAGEVLVKYKESAHRTNAVMGALYDQLGVMEVRYYEGANSQLEHLILEDWIDAEAAIDWLNQSDLVEYAQPNYILSLPTGAKEQILAAESDLKIVAGVPCIPGFDIPGCDPKECWVPGLPFPPGCEDGGNPGNPGNPGDPNPPGNKRPELADAPAEVTPPVADPDLNKAWGVTKIGADQVWSKQRGDKNLVVAVIDTGIDYNHEDLAFNVWRNPEPKSNDVPGFDFIHNDGLPFDDQGHGTHTAGTVGATGGNGKAISGVSQQVSIMALKFLTSRGSGTTADAVRAIDYAIEHGAKIMSNSWGGKGALNNKALKDAVTRSEQKGILFVAAAGNDGADNDGSQASYPAAFDNENILAVAATDQSDKITGFSNYGKTSVDVAAPGYKVYSTLPNNKYGAFSGTSMACPHVAGAAALLWSQHPEWDYKKVKEVLMNTVIAHPSLKGKTVSGGRIDLVKAMAE